MLRPKNGEQRKWLSNRNRVGAAYASAYACGLYLSDRNAGRSAWRCARVERWGEKERQEMA